MFGKYLLHEIKNGWRVPVIFAGVCAALTVFAAVEVYLMSNSEIMYEAPGSDSMREVKVTAEMVENPAAAKAAG